MNKEETIALQWLTGKDHLDDVSLEQLQQLADTYPYFAAAQLLLAKKMQTAKHPQLQEQLYKTALYFPNEQWLRYLLSEGERKQPEEINIAQVEEELHETKETGEATEPFTAPADESIDNDSTDETPINTAIETEDNNVITLPAKTILGDIPTADNEIDEEPEEAPLDEEELQQQSEPLLFEDSSTKIATILSEQAEVFHKPVEDKAEVPIASEPFHAVDYFASQGIQLDKEQPENHFDKRVHKFTDWLRQMKRIHPHPADLGTGEEEENQVANNADSSNYTKEILTESMANVLLKQGKKEKAVEIYQKLSLLHPHKNTYFAALIQQIK